MHFINVFLKKPRNIWVFMKSPNFSTLNLTKQTFPLSANFKKAIFMHMTWNFNLFSTVQASPWEIYIVYERIQLSRAGFQQTNPLRMHFFPLSCRARLSWSTAVTFARKKWRPFLKRKLITVHHQNTIYTNFKLTSKAAFHAKTIPFFILRSGLCL